MDLTLTVTEAPQDANMINHTKAFRAEGGSLGRADKNTWVLPDNDRVVSSTHAKISFDNGCYYLSDTSTNGTFHNDESDPVGPENPIALNSGDTLKIGNYKIKVSVKQPQASLAKGLQSADFLDSGDKTTFTAAVKSEQESLAQVKEFDDLLDPAAPSPTRQAEPAFQNWDSVETSTPNFATHNDTLSGLSSTQSQDPLAILSNESSQISNLSNDPLMNAHSDTSAGTTNQLDPLAQWNQDKPTAQSQWQDNDDDWWLEGSQSDNANALSHAIPNETSAPAPAPAPIAEHQPAEQQPVMTQPQQMAAEQQTANAGMVNHATPQFQQTPQQSAGQQEGWGTANTVQAPTAEAPANNQMSPHLQQPGYQPETIPQPQAQVDPAALQTAPVQSVIQPVLQPAVQHEQTPVTPTQQFQTPAPQQAPAQPIATAQPNYTPAAQPLGTENAQHPQMPNNPAPAPLPPGLAQALGLGDFPEQQLTQLVPEASAIISETVSRLIDLLRARSSIKNELRVQRTMIQATDNNPLKFSASSSEALRIMFSSGNQAYLSPNEAVKDSFDDLSDHQVAVLSGMRAAYDAMLKHFNPDNLDRRFKNSSSLLSNKKAKNWEDFQEHYASLLRDGEASYDLLFGEEFASSYEKQLSELKTARSLTTAT